MRRVVIAANWKMYKNLSEAVAFAARFKEELSISGPEVLVFPPSTALAAVAQAFSGSFVKIGAQNMYWSEEGAFTGEISPLMIKDCGCTHVIIGHSERRQYFGETDANVNKKVKSAFKYGLLPIVCTGETLEEREAGSTHKVVQRQIIAALSGLDEKQVEKIIIAYEPIWAIGTGKTASVQDAQEVNAFIRMLVTETVGMKPAACVRILYGGSVKPANTQELMSSPDIDGALVGGASLDPVSFAAIVRAAERGTGVG